MIRLAESEVEKMPLTTEELNRLIESILRDQVQTVIQTAVGQALRRALYETTGRLDFYDGEPPKPRRKAALKGETS